MTSPLELLYVHVHASVGIGNTVDKIALVGIVLDRHAEEFTIPGDHDRASGFFCRNLEIDILAGHRIGKRDKDHFRIVVGGREDRGEELQRSIIAIIVNPELPTTKSAGETIGNKGGPLSLLFLLT